MEVIPLPARHHFSYKSREFGPGLFRNDHNSMHNKRREGACVPAHRHLIVVVLAFFKRCQVKSTNELSSNSHHHAAYWETRLATHLLASEEP